MQKFKFKKINKGNRGFTLIETMIAMTIFLIVVTVGMGAILNANAIHNQNQATRSILDSLSFTMEDMSRNIRTGYHYHCASSMPSVSSLETSNDCSGGGNILAFESATGKVGDPTDQIIYYFNGTSLFKSIDGETTFVPLTPPEVSINSAGLVGNFQVTGSTSTNMQPYVRIIMSGTIKVKNNTQTFSLQTSVSQRAINSQ